MSIVSVCTDTGKGESSRQCVAPAAEQEGSADLSTAATLPRTEKELSFALSLLPSSPRRLTSSWERVLCCFRASSRCGKHTSGYSGFGEGPFSVRNTFTIARKTRPRIEEPRRKSLKLTICVVKNKAKHRCPFAMKEFGVSKICIFPRSWWNFPLRKWMAHLKIFALRLVLTADPLALSANVYCT